MAEEKQDVEEVESSTTEDVETESSTEQPEEATSQEAAEEVQQVPYDRFQEVNAQKNKAEQEAAYYKGMAEKPVTEAPVSDPDANLDPQTKIFYQELDKRTSKAIDKARAEEREAADIRFTALAAQTAEIQHKLFRQDETDVIPDSPEEIAIAEKVKRGYSIQDATWSVMGAKRVESAKTVGKTKQQNKAQMKDQANVEVSGVPTNSPVQGERKLSFREDLDKRAKEAGI